MDYHHHARLTIYRRELLGKSVVEGRQGLCEAAAAFGLSRQSAAKWVRRYRETGWKACGIGLLGPNDPRAALQRNWFRG